MKKFKIGNKWIGDNKNPFFVAEAGINHNGSLKTAKKLVTEAARNGADAIKFQTYITENFYRKNDKFFKFFKKLELSKNDFGQIRDIAKDNNIEFFSTPLDFESVEVLEELKVPAYKISSGDITFHPLIEKIASKKKPIILSTGMSNFKEIFDALKVIQKTKLEKIILMHSVSSYPTPLIETNLKCIEKMKDKFHFPVGYSDNGDNDFIPVLACALGASMIEKHFTLNSRQKGGDHSMSIEPQDMKVLIEIIKKMDRVIGDGIKKIQPSEKKAIKIARRGVYAKNNLPKEKILKKEDIIFLRPSNKYLPQYNKIIGKKISKSIIKFESINHLRK